jgi:hypothetical protein
MRSVVVSFVWDERVLDVTAHGFDNRSHCVIIVANERSLYPISIPYIRNKAILPYSDNKNTPEGVFCVEAVYVLRLSYQGP